MVYFASDFHLGYPDIQTSRQREKRILSWLETIAADARQLHLVGDIFDFWFEWKKVVPKYFVRFLGTLARLTDNGIEVHFYVGNHDLWTWGYLQDEVGLKVHYNREIQVINGKRFFIEHGDQTPYESVGYKLLTKLFRNRAAQWAFARLLHPDFASKIAQGFSARRDREMEVLPYRGEHEPQVRYVRWLKRSGFDADYYVFGHRHLALQQTVEGSEMIVLGQWFNLNSYAVFDGQRLELKFWKQD